MNRCENHNVENCIACNEENWTNAKPVAPKATYEQLEEHCNQLSLEVESLKAEQEKLPKMNSKSQIRRMAVMDPQRVINEIFTLQQHLEIITGDRDQARAEVEDWKRRRQTLLGVAQKRDEDVQQMLKSFFAYFNDDASTRWESGASDKEKYDQKNINFNMFLEKAEKIYRGSGETETSSTLQLPELSGPKGDKNESG